MKARSGAPERVGARNIVRWAIKTFGPLRDEDRGVLRLEDEAQELREALDAWHARDYPVGSMQNHEMIMTMLREVADVYICACNVAHAIGGDMDKIVKQKHAVNLSRRWLSHGDGTGKHIKQ